MAAVEQVILFPSSYVYKAYLHELNRKETPHEIIDVQNNTDGSIRAIIRKRYNQNDFMPQSERSLQNQTRDEQG